MWWRIVCKKPTAALSIPLTIIVCFANKIADSKIKASADCSFDGKEHILFALAKTLNNVIKVLLSTVLLFTILHILHKVGIK